MRFIVDLGRQPSAPNLRRQAARVRDVPDRRALLLRIAWHPGE
jgi:hypothetical protein